MKVPVISSHIHNLLTVLRKSAVEEEAPVDTLDPTPVEEEKDKDTQLSEHVKNNLDKYRQAFEALFPTTQMAASAVEYRGESTKDKIRVMVDFQTPLLNFDALQVLSDKEIGLQATGENTFKVYNIYLPRVKDPSLK